MRTRLLLIATVLSATAVCAATAPVAPAGREPLASFQAFLDGLGHRDQTVMLAHVLPGGHATLMRKGKPMQMTLEELIQRVSAPGSDSHEERISDPLVRIDNDMAVVWAKFVFSINGKKDHCGTDVATLVKVGNQWLIASIEDTAQPTCAG